MKTRDADPGITAFQPGVFDTSPTRSLKLTRAHAEHDLDLPVNLVAHVDGLRHTIEQTDN